MSQSRDVADASADPYREIAELYDLEHDQFRDDLPLIRQLVETVGDPVLELGCGTGRVLAHLADLDMRLTGVDSSAPMLDRARNRLGSDSDVDLISADMSATGLPTDGFGIVILALNGLLHATTPETQRAVLIEAFRVLDPRGLLFIDAPNPHAAAFDFPDQHVIRETTLDLPDGMRASKFSARTVTRAKQSILTELWYDVVTSAGELTRIATSFELRFLYPSELALMLELAGFVEWQMYGSYDLEPLTDSSPRLIVMAEKTPSR